MDRELPDWLDGGSDHQGPIPQARPPLRGRGPLVVGGCAAAAAIAVAALALTGSRHSPPPQTTHTPLPVTSTAPKPVAGPVPYPLLIADEGDKRMVEVTPDKQVMWQAADPASSAEFSADGTHIAVADEDAGTVSVVDYTKKQSLWTMSSHLDGPYGAHLLPDGNVIVPDVRNCRILILTPAPAIADTWGAGQKGVCQTDLAMNKLGYPNGAVPQADGNVLVTLSGGGSMALFGADGTMLWSVNSPSLYGDIASAANLTPDGHVLVAAMGTPGTLLSFDRKTRVVYWSYHATSGTGELSDPRQAVLLPNGNVAVADSGNDRVAVIDPKTSQIVWSYGGAGVLKHPTSVAVDRWHAAPTQ